MYSVNGTPLDNPDFGWTLRAPSKPLSELTHEAASMGVAGRDGVVGGLPSTTRPPVVSFMVHTPRAHLESLVALFGRAGELTVTGVSGRKADYEVVSHSLDGYGAADAFLDATFLLRLPGAFWRDTANTTYTAALNAASVQVVCWEVERPSAPVQDAMVRIAGPATGIQVTDTSGAWVRLPDVVAGQWVRFESESGRAFRTTSAVWTGGTEVSGSVDFGGPRGVFEITPTIRGGSIMYRAGVVTVTTVTRGGSVDVRGRSAHVL